MKRSAWTLSLLGLVGLAAPAFAQDSKTEINQTQESSPSKSKMKVDKSTKTDTGNGTAKSDSSMTTETKRNSDGTTETQTEHTKSNKAPGRMTSDKTKTTEKTVKDSDGTVLEHEKKTK
jgi:hypothetical protein